MRLWESNLWARLAAWEVVSSTHRARGLERRAGCNADRRCIRSQNRTARERPRLRLVSRSAAFLLARRRGLSGRLLRHDYRLPIFERIRRVDHDLIGGRNSTENLQRRAVVASDVNGAQLHLAVGTDDGDLCTFCAEQHRIHWNGNFIYAGADREVHLSERARQQTTVLVRDIDLCQQSARRGINRLRRAYYFAEELLAGKLLQRNSGLVANLDKRRVRLRDARINPQGIDACHTKQFGAAGTRASVDQRAGINVTACEHAAEWRVDVLKALQLLEAPDIRLSGSQVGLALLVSAGVL